MNYSICYKDAKGRTDHSEFLPYVNDEAAVGYAKQQSADYAIVEVWKGDNLVTRLEADPPVATAAKPDAGDVDSWNNEGGARRAHGRTFAAPPAI